MTTSAHLATPSVAPHAASPRYPAHFGAVVLLRADGTAAGTAPAHHLLRTRALPHSNIDSAAEPLSARLCEHFEGHGTCNRGAKCRFAHRAGSPPPQVTPVPTPACSRSWAASMDGSSMSSSFIACAPAVVTLAPSPAAAAALQQQQQLLQQPSVPWSVPSATDATYPPGQSLQQHQTGIGGGLVGPAAPTGANWGPAPAIAPWQQQQGGGMTPEQMMMMQQQQQAPPVHTPFFVTVSQEQQQHPHAPWGVAANGAAWAPPHASGLQQGWPAPSAWLPIPSTAGYHYPPPPPMTAPLAAAFGGPAVI